VQRAQRDLADEVGVALLDFFIGVGWTQWRRGL
jgi:hypothetical protein